MRIVSLVPNGTEDEATAAELDSDKACAMLPLRLNQRPRRKAT